MSGRDPKIGSSTDMPVGTPQCSPDPPDVSDTAEGVCDPGAETCSTDSFCADTPSGKGLVSTSGQRQSSGLLTGFKNSLAKGVNAFEPVRREFNTLPDVEEFRKLWPTGESFDKDPLELDYSSYGENAQRWFDGTGIAKELAVIKRTDPGRYAAIEEYFARYQEVKRLLTDANASKGSTIEELAGYLGSELARLAELMPEAGLEELFAATLARDQGIYWEYQAGLAAKVITDIGNIGAEPHHPLEATYLLEAAAKRLKAAIPHRRDLAGINLAGLEERRKRLDEVAKGLDNFMSELRRRRPEFERGGIGVEEAATIWREDLRIYNERLAGYASEVAAFQAFYGNLIEGYSKYELDGPALLAEERVKDAWRDSGGHIEKLAEGYERQIGEIGQGRENSRLVNSGQMLAVGGEVLEGAAIRREVYKKAEGSTGEDILEAARGIDRDCKAIDRILEAAEKTGKGDLANIWWPGRHQRREALKMAVDDHIAHVRDALSDLATGKRDWNELNEYERAEIITALERVDTLVASQGFVIFNAGVKGSSVGDGKLAQLCRGDSIKFQTTEYGTDAVVTYLESYKRSGEDLVEPQWRAIDDALAKNTTKAKEFKHQLRLARLEDIIARERGFLANARPTAEDAANYPLLFGTVNLEDFSVVGPINEMPALPYLNYAQGVFASYENRFNAVAEAKDRDEKVVAALERDIDRYFASKERHELGYRLGEDSEYMKFRSEVWFYEGIAETALGAWAAGGIAGWLVGGVRDLSIGANAANAAVQLDRAQRAARWLMATEAGAGALKLVPESILFHASNRASGHGGRLGAGEEALGFVHTTAMLGFIGLVGRPIHAMQAERMRGIAIDNLVKLKAGGKVAEITKELIEKEIKSIGESLARRVYNSAEWLTVEAPAFQGFGAGWAAGENAAIMAVGGEVQRGQEWWRHFEWQAWKEGVGFLVGLRLAGGGRGEVQRYRARGLEPKIAAGWENVRQLEKDYNDARVRSLIRPSEDSLQKVSAAARTLQEGLRAQRSLLKRMPDEGRNTLEFARDCALVEGGLARVKELETALPDTPSTGGETEAGPQETPPAEAPRSDKSARTEAPPSEEQHSAVPATEGVAYLYAGYDPRPALRQMWTLLGKGAGWLFEGEKTESAEFANPATSPYNDVQQKTLQVASEILDTMSWGAEVRAEAEARGIRNPLGILNLLLRGEFSRRLTDEEAKALRKEAEKRSELMMTMEPWLPPLDGRPPVWFFRGPDLERSELANDRTEQRRLATADANIIIDNCPFGAELRRYALEHHNTSDPLRILNLFLRGELGREPTHKEVRRLALIMTNEIGESARNFVFDDPNIGPPIFQIHTKEFLDAYADYLIELIEDFKTQYDGREPRITEICAGDGRFARALNVRLASRGYSIQIRATDLGEANQWEIKPPPDVLRIDAVRAAGGADIILGNWLPPRDQLDLEIGRVVEGDPSKTLIIIGDPDVEMGNTGSTAGRRVLDERLQHLQPDSLNREIENEGLPVSRFTFNVGLKGAFTAVEVFRSTRAPSPPDSTHDGATGGSQTPPPTIEAPRNPQDRVPEPKSAQAEGNPPEPAPAREAPESGQQGIPPDAPPKSHDSPEGDVMERLFSQGWRSSEDVPLEPPAPEGGPPNVKWKKSGFSVRAAAKERKGPFVAVGDPTVDAPTWGYWLVGRDINALARECGRKKVHNLDIEHKSEGLDVQGDVLRLPIGDGTVGVLFVSSLAGAMRAGGIAEAHRVLEDGGLFVFQIFTDADFYLVKREGFELLQYVKTWNGKKKGYAWSAIFRKIPTRGGRALPDFSQDGDPPPASSDTPSTRGEVKAGPQEMLPDAPPAKGAPREPVQAEAPRSAAPARAEAPDADPQDGVPKPQDAKPQGEDNPPAPPHDGANLDGATGGSREAQPVAPPASPDPMAPEDPTRNAPASKARDSDPYRQIAAGSAEETKAKMSPELRAELLRLGRQFADTDDLLIILKKFMLGQLGREPTQKEVMELVELMEDFGSFMMFDYVMRHAGSPVYQIYTKEFLDTYADHLIKLIDDFRRRERRDPKITEVCAGDGRLARALSARLKEHGYNIDIVPTDRKEPDKLETIEFPSDVVQEDAVSAAGGADIILASWLPQGEKLDLEIGRVVASGRSKTFILIGVSPSLDPEPITGSAEGGRFLETLPHSRPDLPYPASRMDYMKGHTISVTEYRSPTTHDGAKPDGATGGSRESPPEAMPPAPKTEYLYAGYDPMPALKQGLALLQKGMEWLFPGPEAKMSEDEVIGPLKYSDIESSFIEPRAEWGYHNPQGVHGMGHVSRVQVLSDIIARAFINSGTKVNLKALRWAAVLHDVARVSDQADPDHGDRSAEWARGHLKELDPSLTEGDIELVVRLIRWHVPSDAQYLGAHPTEELPIELVILKDADALDRARLSGGSALDPKFLRTDEAVALIDFANGLYSNSKHYFGRGIPWPDAVLRMTKYGMAFLRSQKELDQGGATTFEISALQMLGYEISDWISRIRGSAAGTKNIAVETEPEMLENRHLVYRGAEWVPERQLTEDIFYYTNVGYSGRKTELNGNKALFVRVVDGVATLLDRETARKLVVAAYEYRTGQKAITSPEAILAKIKALIGRSDVSLTVSDESAALRDLAYFADGQPEGISNTGILATGGDDAVTTKLFSPTATVAQIQEYARIAPTLALLELGERTNNEAQPSYSGCFGDAFSEPAGKIELERYEPLLQEMEIRFGDDKLDTAQKRSLAVDLYLRFSKVDKRVLNALGFSDATDAARKVWKVYVKSYKAPPSLAPRVLAIEHLREITENLAQYVPALSLNHGSTSASLPGVVASGGLLPAEYILQEDNPRLFSGELVFQLFGGGKLKRSISTAEFSRADTDLPQIQVAGATKWSPDIIYARSRGTRFRENVDSSHLTKRQRERMIRTVEYKRRAWLKGLPSLERAMVTEGFPVIYQARRFYRERVVNVRDERTAFAAEREYHGKLVLGENVTEIFVPRNKIELVKAYLSSHGFDNVDVLPIEDLEMARMLLIEGYQLFERVGHEGSNPIREYHEGLDATVAPQTDDFAPTHDGAAGGSRESQPVVPPAETPPATPPRTRAPEAGRSSPSEIAAALEGNEGYAKTRGLKEYDTLAGGKPIGSLEDAVRRVLARKGRVRILDLGAGEGNAAATLKAKFGDGIEIDNIALQENEVSPENRGAFARSVHQDIDALERFPNERYDLIISVYGGPYYAKDPGRVLEMIADHLEVGGEALVMLPPETSEHIFSASFGGPLTTAVSRALGIEIVWDMTVTPDSKGFLSCYMRKIAEGAGFSGTMTRARALQKRILAQVPNDPFDSSISKGKRLTKRMQNLNDAAWKVDPAIVAGYRLTAGGELFTDYDNLERYAREALDKFIKDEKIPITHNPEFLSNYYYYIEQIIEDTITYDLPIENAVKMHGNTIRRALLAARKAPSS